jgi:catechol 2,3-dioxygenase-like lactoylglutathione lyase family enzyme
VAGVGRAPDSICVIGRALDWSSRTTTYESRIAINFDHCVDAEPVARIPVPPGGSDICFGWDGPLEHLAAHGIPVELGPVARHGARGEGTSVYFRDPDGSLLEFISYH